jgi:hypothetical protein
MQQNRREYRTNHFHPSWAGLAGLAVLLLCILTVAPSEATANQMNQKSDFESLYDSGFPRPASLEWSFPTGFSLGIDSGHTLRYGDGTPVSGDSPSSTDTYPLSFSMKYTLYESYRISQSIGVGFGPYFIHEGETPVQFKDVEITGNSTCATEWVSYLSRDIFLNLKMSYTHAFQSVVNEVPLWDFTTWLGLNVKW